MKSKRGNITIEAAIALPSFILFMMTFVFIFNLLMVHKAMQEALTDSALCMSSYSYIGYKTKVLDIEAEASKAVDQKAGSSKEQIANVYGFYKLMTDGKFVSDPSNFDVLYGSLNSASGSVVEIIKDPKTFGISVAFAISQLVYEEGKALVLSPLTNYMLKNYIENYHGFSQNAVDEIWVEGGMDYQDSRYFGASPEIKLVVHYAVKPMFFDAVLPKLKLSNSIIVRCWGPGDEKSIIEKTTTVGWITPNSIKNGGVFHTMKCMSLNNNNSSKNIQVDAQTFSDEEGNLLFSTVEYNGKTYTHCQNCANGGKIKQ